MYGMTTLAPSINFPVDGFGFFVGFGGAPVVMDKTQYITKCEALLQDNSVYQHLSKDTSPTIHKELIKTLQDYKNNNFIL